MLALPERLQAYLDVVNAEPDLTLEEREHLFGLALWPDPEPDYDHMMRCVDKWCPECAGVSLPAGHPFAPVVEGKLAA